jgi:hypothetical protein
MMLALHGAKPIPEALRVQGNNMGTSRVLATVLKVHDANIPELRGFVGGLLRTDRQPELLPLTAASILQELRMKIMMAVG